MGWWILAAAAAGIAALLACRVRFCAAFDRQWSFCVRYLFFKFRLGQGKTGNAKKERPAPPKKDLLKLFFDHFEAFMQAVRKTARSLLRRMRVDSFTLRLTVARPDAADTAIAYGRACAVVFPAAAFLRGLRHRENQRVSVRPDFTAGESRVEFRCRVSVPLGALAGIAAVRAAALLLDFVRKPGAGFPAPFHQKGSAG